MDKAKILRLCANIEKSLPDLCLTIFYKERDKLIEEAKEIAAEISEKPKINADRIRQMTDDEELLRAIGTGCYRCAYYNGECDSGHCEGCIAGNLAWLKQEVSEDAGSKTD